MIEDTHFSMKRAKVKAARMVRENYVVLIVACLLAGVLGSEYHSSLRTLEASKPLSIVETVKEKQSDTIGLSADSLFKGLYEEKIIELVNSAGIEISSEDTEETILQKLAEGKIAESEEIVEQNQSNAKSTKILNVVELGRSQGVLSSLVNNISSGQFLVIAFETINSVVKSDNVTTSIFIVLSALIMLAIIIFVKDAYKVSFRRVFMETHKYSHVKLSSFFFLYRVNKYIKASMTIFVTNVLQFLWNFTIVGGVIKHYSYFMVPYIVAENPGIDTKKAIKLSEDIMRGHKFECFKYELSFVGWMILGMLSFGLSEIFFSNAYKEASFVEYYAYIRSLAKQNNVVGTEVLQDYYLFHVADQETLNKTYADVVEIMNDDIVVENYLHKGFRGFIENNLGLIYKKDSDEDGYNVATEQEVKIDQFKYCLEGKQYPERLSPEYKEKSATRLEQVHYLRHYSFWSVVVLFFVFCFIGWSWEVMLHIVEDGVFVNRGVLHGPWLPIYGSGGCLILLLLFRFRKNVGKEAISAIILCGIVEYFTSLFLEITKGTKWWDYSGYFLNIDGRICAEGLLVFMLGGLLIVYFLAPMVDDLVKKANKKILIPICVILLVIFSVDMVYSSINPNTGKGITDYDTVVEVE